MSEFPAEQARNITNKKDQLNSEKWYSIWKDNFFAALRKEALRGNNYIIIESEEWYENEHNKKYLTSKLISLGYSVNANDSEMQVFW